MSTKKPTGNVELDVCARIATLMPGIWTMHPPRRTLWDGPEVPASGAGGAGVVMEDACFVELITTRHDRYEDTQMRYFDVSILRRFARGPSADARRKARDEAMKLYDALDCSGAFVGANSGGDYHDIRAIDSPTFLDDQHYVFDITVWRLG